MTDKVLDNNLFFTCSLIDYIARRTKNHRSYVVNQLGKERIKKIYELSDIYHCENIDKVSDEFIAEADIKNGTFDNVNDCKYNIPGHFDIGKVYKRLVKGIMKEKNMNAADAIIEAYNSYVSEKIDDYNSSFYYDAPQNILNAYIYGYIE